MQQRDSTSSAHKRAAARSVPTDDARRAGSRRQRANAVHRGRRAFHAGDDPPPCTGSGYGRMGADPRRASGCENPRATDRRGAARRDGIHAALAEGAPSGCPRSARALPDGTRHAGYADGDDARNAHRGADVAARCGPRTRFRPSVPDLHDPAPSGRDHDGGSALRDARRRTGAVRLSFRVGCECRSDHGNRAHAPDVGRRRSVMTSTTHTRLTMTSKSLLLSISIAMLAACARSSTVNGVSLSGVPDMSPTPPSPDPRVGLAAGWFNDGQAIRNLRAVSMTRPSEKFLNESAPGDRRLVNSDLAFMGNYVFQGNYSGWQMWDISNPSRPRLKTAYVCPGSQSDVSVYHSLLFVSAEATNGRVDCGMQGVPDTVSNERARGIRVIDMSDAD